MCISSVVKTYTTASICFAGLLAEAAEPHLGAVFDTHVRFFRFWNNAEQNIAGLSFGEYTRLAEIVSNRAPNSISETMLGFLEVEIEGREAATRFYSGLPDGDGRKTDSGGHQAFMRILRSVHSILRSASGDT